jgi:activator of HSP90 ATPase
VWLSFIGFGKIQYVWTLTTASTPAVSALFELAKSRLSTALETKFAEFPAAIIDTHGKDLTVSADPSRSGTPAPPGASTAAATSATPGATPAATASATLAKAKVNNNFTTSKVHVEATFMASASDLFSLLTDEKRIPTWSRAAAQVNITA